MKPADSSVDQNVLVTVRAIDRFGNTAVSEARPVSLVANTTLTGAGLVQISSGVGQKTLHSTQIGWVKLSLLDAVGMSGVDFSSSQVFQFYPGK